jgi:ClpP class serine protease
MFSTLLQRVFLLPLHGHITPDLSNHVHRSLSKSTLFRPLALVVSLDSPGGSLTQACLIRGMLRTFVEKRGVPLICVAQDRVLGSALVLLAAGFKVVASPFAQFGDIGFARTPVKQHGLLEKIKVHAEFRTAG